MKKLPEQIPVFPLTGAILLPKGHLPLNIFEPRYLEMVEKAHDTNKIIGMIQPRGTNTSMSAKNNNLFGTAKGQQELYNVGCAGLITEMEKTAEGQYFIVLTGINRFEVIEELPQINSFREVQVDYSAFRQDSDQQLINREKRKEVFFKTLNQYLTKLDIEIELSALEDIEDEELINSMAMICPFDAAEKQLLLESSTLDNRIDLMVKIMDFNLTKHPISSGGNLH